MSPSDVSPSSMKSPIMSPTTIQQQARVKVFVGAADNLHWTTEVVPTVITDYNSKMIH